MQHVWTLGLDWDSLLPVNSSNRWSTFIKEFPNTKKLKTTRYLSLSSAINIQMHVFLDDSHSGSDLVFICERKMQKIILQWSY